MGRLITLLLPALLFATPALAGPYEDGLAIVNDARRLATQAQEAEAAFQQATQADPRNAHAWYNLGLLAFMRGDGKIARSAWQSAIEADPGYDAARARLAEMKLRAGQRTKAVEELEALVATDPYQAEARLLLAEVSISSSQWEAAIKHARNVLLGDPDNANAYLNLAVAYYRQDLIDQAWLITTNGLDRRPDAAALHNMMGLIYLAKDDSRRASESFLKALEANPREVDAKLNLAALELSYGDFDKALGRFDEVLEVRRDDALVVLSRAVALRGLQRFDEAQAGYEAALALAPGMAEAQYNLCVLHHQYTNQWKEARRVCGAYYETLDPKHAKRREIKRRLRSIEATIEALGLDKPPEPAPIPGGDTEPPSPTP